MITVQQLVWSRDKALDEIQDVFDIDYDGSAYTTTEDAAKGFHVALVKAVRECPEFRDYNTDIEISLMSPEQTKQVTGSEAWCVMFEAGPHEWAIGTSMEVRGPWGHTEPYYSFDLHFYGA